MPCVRVASLYGINGVGGWVYTDILQGDRGAVVVHYAEIPRLVSGNRVVA